MAANLPPGSAIHRGDDLDSKVFSLEAALLRMWINLNLQEKDRIPTADVAQERAAADARRKAKLQAKAQLLARRKAVTDG